MNITTLTIWQIKELLWKKEISVSDLINEYLSTIYEKNETLNAFLHINEGCINQAESSQKKYIDKTAGELEGIPIAIKDNICTVDQPTTCASKILKGYMSPFDAHVIKKLRDAGAILIGKTNMDEFAFGSSTENSAFGPTLNPYDTQRVPGGSSGGSAAAVAADMVPGALGSDTGGSIRQPASFCGVVGLKPSYGRVSRYGLVAFGSSLDQIGPFAKSVKDVALILKVIAGYDQHDSTCCNLDVPEYDREIEKDIEKSKIKIGIPEEYFQEGLSPEIREKINKILDFLENNGFFVEKINLPHTHYGIPTYYIISTAEASTNLARFDGVKFGYRSKDSKTVYDLYVNSRGEGFGQEAKRRIMLGTFVLSAGYYEAYYLKAQKVRTLIMKDFENAFSKVSFIITPTTPETAFKLGEKSEKPLMMYLSDIYTVGANLAGIPGINLPIGFSSGKLPIGMQILAPAFKELDLLQFAYYIEQNFTRE
ncbi:MAG: Asp-tRNA(Asn)/Glu-tRNA(Gln) amidotransferase subunit GatA [Candidatus Omnitrophica bacterium]|nr:Asp-tRNA(Asn)/Glu-tRNA(Gln) amidotransferase subunit GatA [Candidatus Omnitrophota bacterium]MCM8816812.1 Asp-tRNA(Asn)/Glu-tRNA(Gln) amidotransferase subunit GatA [Candidatus Omnitrophota bacterium]